MNHAIKQTLSLQNTIAMGFMAFAMFLGAGNLIFPPLIGFMAGEQVWYAAAGFLVTGVGLPLLGIVAIARVGGDFNNISQELPKGLVIALASSIYLIIGPVYAVPRTALVAFEIGIEPFLPSHNAHVQLIFSLLFFSIAWYLSIRPGKLLETVGKLITPALIILLALLGLSPVFAPLGSPGESLSVYQETPLIGGFLEGYMTMDTLAALMFGIVIITNLKSHGIQDKTSLFHYSMTTGIIAAIGLSLVYLSLFYLGATSRAIIASPENGGQILASYAYLMFGNTGAIMLACVVTLACLTTAIGCITAASEYFNELFSFVSYRTVVTIVSATCVVFANMGGLGEIIELFIPALQVLYPISIVLILLGLFRHRMPHSVLIYRSTLATAFLFSVIDLVKDQGHPLFTQLLRVFDSLPGYHNHMLWVLPALAMFLISLTLSSLFKQPESLSN
ncbi:branched-chain amino acid transport system II carrier protein [uncultured Endozoicomonas sp.]|uniref:branched-chain amino acid transport system II carrier protein n=1 Tax=uncultured Endozoicomonas sp. TaxID=432652 RepID=UPI002636C27E|nr:branched-chain amino acid transport system II carrier protein [uncultured Endozoicomonas sp.]